MKKIIIHLLIFLAAIVVADRGGTYLFTHFIFAKVISGDSGGGVNYLLQKKQHSDFIILGSSRAKHQINPALLTNVYNGNGYNAGIDGAGGIAYSDMLLHMLLTNGAKPKLIILQLDPYPYFSDGNENITNEILPLYPFLGKSEVLQQYTYEHITYDEKFKLLFHSYRYSGKFFRELYNYEKRNSIVDNNGFEALYGNFDSANFIIPDEFKTAPAYSTVKIKTLIDLIQTCNKSNITLSVVYPPSYKNIALIKPAFDTISAILRQNGVTNIFNYAEIDKMYVLQNAALWKDFRHLNNNGAIIFSNQLNNAMKVIK